MSAIQVPTSDVKDLGLASLGKLKIEWAEAHMPVLRLVRERFTREQPLRGLRIAACLHVTTETANLVRTLQAGGAEVSLCASNPLSTQDDAAASLVADYGASVYAIKGEDDVTYYRHIEQALARHPQVTMDDGADLVTVLHTKRSELLPEVLGGTEETTTGVIRLRSMAEAGALRYPIVAVNEAMTKHFFDNRYGTGQSTIDGILRATNMLLAGRNFVVAGYGWCGRGVARRASGLGAHVIVTEVDPVRALEAVMDGYRVMPMAEAAAVGEIFVTTTGDIHAVSEKDIERLRDGAVLANSGHFNVEIDISALRRVAVSSRHMRPFVEEFVLADGRRVYLLGEGRLINLAAAEGHPAEVMDMSFANQSLSVEYLVKHGQGLNHTVCVVPIDIDREVARLKLDAMGLRIDTLTEEQARYLASWESGT
ncbi:MAG: adenosylhomocysteinase [Chloroflexi bacterium]|nr:adenosylhomocysteinase [Chloroflexota bacterium]MCL5108163.1 adenosylhomocysteinase [Chloroflexota bacterium]